MRSLEVKCGVQKCQQGKGFMEFPSNWLGDDARDLIHKMVVKAHAMGGSQN